MSTQASAATPVLDADAMIADARKQTGLQDFGAPDVVEPLRILVDSFNRDAHLSAAGVMGQQMNLTRLLVNRLRMQVILNEHPEIRKEEIRGPIVIVGLPRSGTTKLQRMMAADPAFQKLPFWRMLSPLPMPGEKPGDPSPRIAVAEAATRFTRENFPEFHAAHPMGATEPEEEDFLMEHSFATSVTYSSHRLPSYMDWALKTDPKPYYDQLKLFLQMFQWEDHSAGKMWLVKATCHLHRLRWLFEAFPNTILVHCHRDPLTSLTSLTDMFYVVRGIASDKVDPLEVGDFTLNYSRDQLQQYMDQRDVLEKDHNFVDVAFKDIVAKPFEVIESIYRAANIPLTDEARAAMQKWEDNNPQHKHGKRDYQMEKFGYTEERLKKGMAHYIGRFSKYM